MHTAVFQVSVSGSSHGESSVLPDKHSPGSCELREMDTQRVRDKSIHAMHAYLVPCDQHNSFHVLLLEGINNRQLVLYGTCREIFYSNITSLAPLSGQQHPGQARPD